MKKNIIISLFLLVCCFLYNACRKEPIDTNPAKKNPSNITDVEYASTFDLKETDSLLIYQRISNNDTINLEIPKNILPLKHTIVMSSSLLGYFSELDAFDNIKGIYNVNWIFSPQIHEMVKDKEIKNLGNYSTINLEQILVQNPDAIITFSEPNLSKILESASSEGIPIIYIDEFLEKTPLGKAEYIKLFGRIFGKDDLAKDKFKKIENNYNSAKKLAAEIMNQPLVFSNIMRGDIWYMPGGESFSAKYISDAGADYLWGEDKSTGSIQLNFEQVLEKAKEADFWINTSDFTLLEQLGNAYPNHKLFKAFQNGNVFSHNKRVNSSGANDYFETGNIRPDLVLKDLIKIFHPSIYPEYETYFYQRLK